MRKKRLLDAYEKGVIEMNELSERLAALDEALAKYAQPKYIPSVEEIENFILEFKNLKEKRAIVDALVTNIIVDTDKSYEIVLGVKEFSTK